MSLELAVLNSSREFTSKAGGYAFDMSGVLSVRTSDGLDIEIPLTYAGDALPGYNSANISLTAPSKTVEYKVIAVQNMDEASDETVEIQQAFFDAETRRWVGGGSAEMRQAFFDAETRRWVETEELITISALTDFRVLLGSDFHETSDIVTDGQMRLTGQEMFDGAEIHVISGKLSVALITGTETELEVTYRVGVGDVLPRLIEVSGELDPSIIGALVEGISAKSVSVKLAVSFSDYGKDVAYKSPYLAKPRFSHDATLLDDGRVLMSGGFTAAFDGDELIDFGVVEFSETYDPATLSWTLTDKAWLAYKSWQVYHQALEVLIYPPTDSLPDGRVIGVAHDHIDARSRVEFVKYLAVFNPETDEWETISDIPLNRTSFDMAVLGDGRVLIVGGYDSNATSSTFSIEPLDITETYNPDSGEWRTFAPMNEVAMEQALVRLSDGRVMAVGGFDDPNNMSGTARAEIFDPETDIWTLTGAMNIPRTFPEAIALSDGRVLVAGAGGSQTAVTDNVPNSETYEPATGEWTFTGAMSVSRAGHTLTLLPDGRVLAAGGGASLGQGYVLHSATEIFDPVTNTWSPGPELSEPRSQHSATLLPDGSVLLAGGIGQRQERYAISSSEHIRP